MAVKLKLLILLVALVALPLRGMAAVAMWHCAQDQHDESALAEGHDHHAQADGHGHEGSAHDSRGGHEVDQSHDHEAVATGDAGGSQGSPAASSCSACAACCVGGAVVPAGWTSVSPEPRGAGVIAFAERGFTGVVPAQLERPPLVRSR